MTFKQFLAFATVVRHMNVTKAANELGTSQPTLSKHLKSLERSFGFKLFSRKGSGLELTEIGEQFYDDLRRILTGLESIDRKYLQSAETKRPRSKILRLHGTYGPSAEILPRLLAVYKKSHPEVEITLGANSSTNICGMIQKGKIDLAVTSRFTPFSLIAVEPFVLMKVTAFVSAHNPLAKKHTLDLADLETMPLIVRSRRQGRGATEQLFAEARAQGYNPNVVMRCQSPEALKTAVHNKLGIGFLFDDAVKQEIARGGFKRIHFRGLSMQGQTYILFHKERPLSPHTEAFLNLLRQWRDKTTVIQTVTNRNS
jgi:DNA-binding transcriptional LysR family regulator